MDKIQDGISQKLDSMADKTQQMLRAENMYKNASWFLFVILIVVSFFVSLGSSEFDFNKILEAQFWIDFATTFLGGMVIKYAFGKWGDYEGHKNPQVTRAIADVNADHATIRAKNLLEKLATYIKKNNDIRKLKKLKTKVYRKLMANETSKRWQKKKKAVIVADSYIKETDSTKKEELRKELEALNFDLDSYKIKYPRLSESSLQTGFAHGGGEDETFSYSEMYELFGKNFFMTLFSFIMTVILAVTTVFLDDISLKTVFIFATRVATFAMNAYLGFAIGKSGVERIKLNILQSIHRFLSTFIEVNQEVR